MHRHYCKAAWSNVKVLEHLEYEVYFRDCIGVNLVQLDFTKDATQLLLPVNRKSEPREQVR